MAGESRRRDPSVAQTLFEQPYRFGFFQAVRLLHLLYPERSQRVTSKAASSENLRPIVALFRAWLSLEFPAGEIHMLELPNESNKVSRLPEMTVSFMGLTGPSGVLPRHYTELLITRHVHHRDSVAKDFFDLFNHRLISLFCQAWEKYHFFIGYERGDRETFTRYVLDLIGMGTRGMHGRLCTPNRDRTASQGMDNQTLVYYGGLIAQRPHSANALAAILGDYFGIKVKVEQFRGRWLQLDQFDRTRLGKGSRNNVLGDTVQLGERIWDQQSSLRVTLGPMSKAQFDQFLPDGAAFVAASRFIRFFLGPGLDYEIQLVLDRKEVPACRLGMGYKDIPRLGWSVWLMNQAFTRHADDAVFRANAVG